MTLSFADYDVLAFDLDNTLARYKLDSFYKLCEDSIRIHLGELGYPLDELVHHRGDNTYLQKGLFYDKDLGHIIKLDSEHKILRAYHGTRMLSDDEIVSSYGKQKTLNMFKKLPVIRDITRSPVSDRIVSYTDYFTVGTQHLYMKLVEILEEKNENGNIDYHQPHNDMFGGYSNMYRREAYREHTGYFFPKIKEHPESIMNKCSTELLAWLKQLKEQRKVVLITSSNADYAKKLLEFCIGSDWRSYFDLAVAYARKPSFFTKTNPFYSLGGDDFEKDALDFNAEALQEGGVYAQGNWKLLEQHLQHITGKKQLKTIYFGDHLVDDILVPRTFCGWDTVAIVEEIEHDFGGSRWGSYFSVDGRHTLWADVIRRHATMAAPSVECLASNPISHRYTQTFNGESWSSGYYPRIPT